MSLRRLLPLLLMTLSVGAAEAQEPYWWSNPHQDDSDDMYERGASVGAHSEQAALLEAVASAKNMIVQRIGIVPALKDAGIDSSAQYAIVDIEVVGSGTDKNANGWSAWVLIKYPQERKKELLDRWKTSIASIKDVRSREPRVPVQFDLSLGTSENRLQYQEGEAVKLTVSAEKDCFLLVIDYQSDGSIVLLYPNRFHPTSFIRKGSLVQIPSPKDATFELRVQAPYGDDRVEAIASTKESALHARLAEVVKELPSGQDLALSTRGIVVQGLASAMESSKEEAPQWSHAELILSTFPAK